MQCAILCAFLGAIAVGVWLVAYDSRGGREIHQSGRVWFMVLGAGIGFVVGGLIGTERKSNDPRNNPRSPDLNKKL